MRGVLLASVAAAVIGIGSETPLFGQQGTGELRGRISDQQRAVLPGVTVVARNEQTGMFREAVTTADGSFFMTALTPGVYEITAQLSGFKKYQRQGVRVEVGKTQSIDVQLDIGAIEQQVTVTGESPIVDTTSKAIGGNVQTQELNDIPSINRNFTSYLSLLPGVTATISTDSFGADSIRINGQNVRDVNYTFDGAGNNDTFNAGNGGAQARVPVEAVQEFQLLTSQFDAEFGSSAGGVVNAVSKQGTNQLHGTAFLFDQNQNLTARDYFAEQQDLAKPETRQVQWGGNLGGPIVKDKLHFFVNLERIDQNRGRTINIPSRPELNFTDFTHDNVWNWMVRMDHQINANNTWAVRWLRESSPQTNQFPSTNWTRARSEQEEDVDWTVVGTLSSVIGSTRVNTLKLSYTHEDVLFGNTQFFANGRDQAALGPRLVHQTFQDGPSGRASRRMDPAYQLDETFAWFVPGRRGDHDLKFGVNYVYMPLHIYNASDANGVFAFSASDAEFDPANPRTYPDRFSILVPSAQDFIQPGHWFGGFAQDKWKVSPRLTLSAGVRYDVEVVPIDEANNPAFADPSKYPVDRNNVSPRLGATWTLDEAGTAVVRGGWGLFYQKTPFSFFTAIASSGVFSDSFLVTFPANNIDPGPSAGRLPSDPFLVGGPTVNRRLLDAMFRPGATQKNSGTVQFDNPDRHLPFSRQLSIGFEKQLRGAVALSADYIHGEQRDLYMRQDLNPGLRLSTSRTARLVRIDPNFVSSVLQIVNAGWADYNALQLSLVKRFSRNYSFRLSYTRSRGFGNVTSPGNIETITTQVLDRLNLESAEGRTGEDRPHVLSIDGSVLVPHTGGLLLSGVTQYQSGTPFTLTDSSSDPDRNGFFQEPLPAGRYSGVGGNAITVENNGGFRGARGPDYLLINMRAGYRFKLPGDRSLQVHVDVFNLTNRANFNSPVATSGGVTSSDRRNASTFLVTRSILNGGPTRTAQLNVKFTF
jgi:carboxypeptidase family protein/TonB-dependent receptor-like protein